MLAGQPQKLPKDWIVSAGCVLPARCVGPDWLLTILIVYYVLLADRLREKDPAHCNTMLGVRRLVNARGCGGCWRAVSSPPRFF